MTCRPHAKRLPMTPARRHGGPIGRHHSDRTTEWQYEPKWDGFRCLAFRDGARVELQSKSARPLTRYFPDLVEALRALKPSRFVLDGEIAVPGPRAYRSTHCCNGFTRQRAALRGSLMKPLPCSSHSIFWSMQMRHCSPPGRCGTAAPHSKISRADISAKTAGCGSRLRRRACVRKFWLGRVGSALDGIVAKRVDLVYQSGERTGMQKIKSYRSADCVVGGFRYNEGKPVVGSLLLGLYDERSAASRRIHRDDPRQDKPALTKKLEA